MQRLIVLTLFATLVAMSAAGQTPQPFPRPGTAERPTSPRPQPPPQPAPAPPRTQAPVEPTAPPATPAAAPLQMDADEPSAEDAFFPVYPAARFIAAYDAGRGQRYLVYGSTAAYADLVTYYRGQLREGGDEVFEEPPTHMFEVGRFRNETMAFPPGVTVKDWTWGGSPGYPNPRIGTEPARYPSIIVIVPPPDDPAQR